MTFSTKTATAFCERFGPGRDCGHNVSSPNGLSDTHRWLWRGAWLSRRRRKIAVLIGNFAAFKDIDNIPFAKQSMACNTSGLGTGRNLLKLIDSLEVEK